MAGSQERRKAFSDLVRELNMENFVLSKLTLRDILSIGPEALTDCKPQRIADIIWCALRKIMSLNITARNSLLDDLEANEENDLFHMLSMLETAKSQSIHPLDVICVLLYCSDRFLQQEIITKMSMCQFSVPLLLPPGDGPDGTFMLWAMRDIVKKWRPESLADSKGFMEDNVVNIEMPVFSFVRLGKNKLSKSKTLNHILNPEEQHYSFFIHDNVEGGNLERRISDRLVEISWYFPSGKSDIFPEPIAVTNLRGDLESGWEEFLFLGHISSAVFIFMENIDEREFRLLSNCGNIDTKFYFIVTPGTGKDVSRETAKFLKDLLPLLNSDNTCVIVKNKGDNKASMTKKIQMKIKHVLKNHHRRVKLGDISQKISGHPFVTDENVAECQKANEDAEKIIREIQDVADYKKRTMRLQRDPWKELSKLEKECCRMKNQGDKDAQKYQSDLVARQNAIRKEQYEQQIPKGIKLFSKAITNRSQQEKHYFLRWMKFKLDAIARNNLSTLQSEYMEKINTKSYSLKELKELDQKISDSSLGIEHFLRELGQFYEAECSMVKQNLIQHHQKKCSNLPGIAADLLLDGFPLELIDGDASNIPLQWITDVLTELDKKTGGQCRMRVITVLGVQSTGKSTLLNTMFGLQFPVASGRCTRGAFMTLIKIEEAFQKELGCDYVLVVDTEGLKAPELASLDESYEHDNELATLVVGLSDITIVNMAMENTTEIKDILQIAVHAFLRMKDVGKKPSCQFVHQNVSDVSAHGKNMTDRKKHLEQLNEITKTAAKMEKKNGIKTFSDVMDYDLEKHNWYIPGLWQGDPPMAPVNLGYSANIFELKKYLFEFMKTQKSLQMPLNISEFISWIENLWKAVKYDKFIYSFRNSLVAKAYNRLCIEFSNWEWEFIKRIHDWSIKMENQVKNQSTAVSYGNKNELQDILLEEENKMIASLERYYDNSKNVNLIERYREEFRGDIKQLRKELERNSLNKYDEAVFIQKGKLEIQNIQNKGQKFIEEEITKLLEICREKKRELSGQEIKQEFEAMWKKTLSDFQFSPLKRRDVGQVMLQQLKKDMSSKGPHINESLIKVTHLSTSPDRNFKVDKSYVDLSWTSFSRNPLYVRQELYDKVGDLASSLINTCEEYIKEKVKTSEDYADVYCRELLHIINSRLQSKPVKKLHFTSQFVLDIKLFIFGKASGAFQALHDGFIHQNDPELCLERLKPQYFSTFLSIFQKKDECQNRARHFCDLCLRPAITQYIFKHLGTKIVDDILGSSDSLTFSSRSFFQCTVLEKLLKENSFKQYVEYINSYEMFSKAWILNYITKKYRNPLNLQTLEKNLLSCIDKVIRRALNDDRCLKSNTAQGLLHQFCEMLKAELVIPQKEMNVITFHNLVNVEQLSADIQQFLKDTETQILSELKTMTIEDVLSKLTLSPQDELFRKVIGCGHQCPFCCVPCEAGGADHKEHFASVHRPQGFGRYHFFYNKKLFTNICSTNVTSEATFENLYTGWEPHPYKEYRTYYPDWAIQPDPSIQSSDYWKYIFAQFNERFAEEYRLQPADLPDDWYLITKEQALSSLKKTFNLN
ncbi:up-regulator of cell proliferation-like [Dendropsophus ebraccatus]|uniref:up-regulator of cell proliferation-like n=1 Tax=Dendropsophus ebraccatus TaxID=150705 RepID=UPI00383160D4